MERPSWAPAEVDLDRPSAARVYDYFLGGAHNFAVDRALAQQIAAMTPDIGQTMRANRAFLRRAVRFLLAQGITQFLDIGSGIPTVGNVHEVAHQATPEANVVYVDLDPVAVAHSSAILAGNPRTAVIQADARDTAGILAHPELHRLLDLTRPVGVLLLGVLHFIPDGGIPDGGIPDGSSTDGSSTDGSSTDGGEPAAIVARLRDAVVPGSYAVLVNATDEDQPPEVIEAQKLSGRTGTPIYLRSRAALSAQLAGFTLVEPGLVHLPLWRPDSPLDVDEHPERYGAFAGVGRKD